VQLVAKGRILSGRCSEPEKRWQQQEQEEEEEE
jgi:hypothetical protein